MQGRSILKVPGGKLIKTRLDYDGGKIASVMITGDFFAHPEEGIEMLESELVGAELDREKLLGLIQSCVKSNGVVLFGIDPVSLVSSIMDCVEGKGGE